MLQLTFQNVQSDTAAQTLACALLAPCSCSRIFCRNWRGQICHTRLCIHGNSRGVWLHRWWYMRLWLWRRWRRPWRRGRRQLKIVKSLLVGVVCAAAEERIWLLNPSRCFRTICVEGSGAVAAAQWQRWRISGSSEHLHQPDIHTYGNAAVMSTNK